MNPQQEVTQLISQYQLFCLAEKIRHETKKTVEGIVTIGNALKEAQEILKASGGWVQWLKDEFEWSHQTAYNFINAADLISRYPILLSSEFTMSAIYLLASSTDEEIERVISETEGKITKGSILTMRAQKWRDAVSELMEVDEGAAYHAIEKAMHDVNLHAAALDLFSQHEEIFANLAGEDVPTVQKDIGMTFDERNPKPPGTLPPQCQMSENAQGVHIVVWLEEGDKKMPYTIATFHRQLPPAAMAYRNAALHGSIQEIGIRPWDFEMQELL